MTNDMRVFLKTLCAIFATLVMTVLWMWFTLVMFMRLVFLDIFSLIGLPLLAIIYAWLMRNLWRWARSARSLDPGVAENRLATQQDDRE